MDYHPIETKKEFYKQHSLSISLTILISLYLIQGILLGFFGNLPVLWLTQNPESTDATTKLPFLTFISYPFSLKLLFAPLQDMYYSSSFGRRKTYIIPCYYMIGIICFLFANNLESCVINSESTIITIIGFILALLNAMSDIGVDGWALTLLDSEHVGWGSVCQNIGQTIGIAIGGPIFIALNSLSFCNNYLNFTPQEQPLLTVHSFFIILSIFVILTTIFIHFFAREKPEPKKQDNKNQLSVVFTTFKGFYINKNIRFLMFLLITWRFGFSLILLPAPYILLQKGFSKELLSSLSIIMIPLDLLISFLIGKFVKPGSEFKVFFIQFFMRIFDGIYVFFICNHFHSEQLTFWLPLILTSETICRIYSTASFVNFGAFFNRIADERIGGTYITALNSCHNLGFQLSKTLALFIFTYADFKIMTIFGITYELLYIVFFNKKIKNLQTLSKDEWKINQVKKKI